MMKLSYTTAIKIHHLRSIANYLLIFAVLSNLLYVPCYFYMRQINRSNIIVHYQENLNSGMQIMDASIESAFAFSILLSEDEAYKKIYYSNPDIDSDMLNDLRQIMRTYTTLPYSFISNYGLLQNGSLLFTKSHVFFSREYLTSDYYFRCDNEDYFDKFTNAYCFLPAEHFTLAPMESYDAVTLGYRCSASKDIYFFVLYPVQELLSLFVSNEVADTSNIAVYFGDTLLFSSENLSDDRFERLIASSSASPELRVELQLSDRFIDADLTGFKHLVQIFLITILLTMCLWVALFSWRMATPFNKISKTMCEAGNFSMEFSAGNSIDIMVESIRKMVIKLSDYEKVIELQKENNRMHLLEKALYRGLYDEASRHSFVEAFPDFPAHWQLVLIQYIANVTVVEMDSIQLLLTHYFQQSLADIILLSYSQDSLLAFFPVKKGILLSDELEDRRNEIQEQYPISISFVTSRIYDSYNSLPDALQELEYASFAQQQLSSADLQANLPISIQQLQTIYLALSNGDEQMAVSALRSSFSSPSDGSMAKYTHQMIAYTLTRIKIENNILDVPIPTFNKENAVHLFEVEFPRCFAQIIARLNEQHDSQMRSLDKGIFAFINDNIGNQQLCISMVTDQFHISAPTLQKRIHACVGKTFSAYVEELRMKRAHQMLHESDLPIQEIARAVGYTNANSFYKAYKRHYGEAPRSTRQNAVTWED